MPAAERQAFGNSTFVDLKIPLFVTGQNSRFGVTHLSIDHVEVANHAYSQ
jgi:hypothetical protein